jgi:hypothetical protein
VPCTSAVSVLVIDCTTIGAPPPTFTPPTITGTLTRRGLGPAISTSAATFAILFIVGSWGLGLQA